MTFLEAIPTNRYVYFHIRKDNLVVFYVGKGTATRLNSLYSRNDHWRKIVNDAGGFIATKIIDGMTDEEAYTAEAILIDSMSPDNRLHLCNKVAGGKGGLSPSAETREKQRNAKLGRKASDETRKKMSAASKGNSRIKGRKCTAEHCSKISAALRKRIRTKSTGEKISKARLGHTVSESTRIKISESKKGVPWTAEQREKMHIARLNKVKYGHVS